MNIVKEMHQEIRERMSTYEHQGNIQPDSKRNREIVRRVMIREELEPLTRLTKGVHEELEVIDKEERNVRLKKLVSMYRMKSQGLMFTTSAETEYKRLHRQGIRDDYSDLMKLWVRVGYLDQMEQVDLDGEPTISRSGFITWLALTPHRALSLVGFINKYNQSLDEE